MCQTGILHILFLAFYLLCPENQDWEIHIFLKIWTLEHSVSSLCHGNYNTYFIYIYVITWHSGFPLTKIINTIIQLLECMRLWQILSTNKSVMMYYMLKSVSTFHRTVQYKPHRYFCKCCKHLSYIILDVTVNV